MAVQGTREIVFALREHGQDVERSVADELAVLAQTTVRTMQRFAPKDRSTLQASIHAKQTGPLEYEIRPGVAYAPYVEDGVKPGGKGLPRFFDPASGDIVGWLQRHPRGGGIAPAKARFGSKAFTAANLELRDRYEGLAWHVRKKGVKASPFVEPTHQKMQPEVLQRLSLAVRRVLAARPGDTGGVA